MVEQRGGLNRKDRDGPVTPDAFFLPALSFFAWKKDRMSMWHGRDVLMLAYNWVGSRKEGVLIVT